MPVWGLTSFKFHLCVRGGGGERARGRGGVGRATRGTWMDRASSGIDTALHTWPGGDTSHGLCPGSTNWWGASYGVGVKRRTGWGQV